MKLKLTLCLYILLSFSHVAWGQKIRINERIKWVNVPKKESLISQWKRYVTSAQRGESVARFWDVGSEDQMPHLISGFYYDFNQELMDIQIDSNGSYCLFIDAECHTKCYPEDIKGVYYRLYAIRQGGSWRFIRSFDYKQSQYTHIATRHIDLYTSGITASYEQLMLAERFIDSFEKEFGVEMQGRVKQYYYAGSGQRALDDAIGVILIRNSNDNDYSARYLVRSNTIVSPTPTEFHELVHAVMYPNYPKAHRLLHEGLATYVGSTKATYNKGITQASYYLGRNKVDFTTSDGADEILRNNATVFNAIGAVIIEYCYLERGAEGVRKLFELSDYNSIFDYLGIKRHERTEFIYALLGKIK